MGGPQYAQPTAGNQPGGSEALVLLAGPATAAERVLVKRWLRDGHPRPFAALPLDGPDLARSLDQAVPETVVTAVRGAAAGRPGPSAVAGSGGTGDGGHRCPRRVAAARTRR